MPVRKDGNRSGSVCYPTFSASDDNVSALLGISQSTPSVQESEL